MIIDFHTHVFSPEVKNNREKYVALDPVFKELYSNPKAKLITAEDLISAMDEQGIDKSVILNIAWASSDLCVRSNDFILESIARYPGRLFGFCAVRFESPDEAVKELERCARNGAKGVGEIRPEPDMLKKTASLKPIFDHMIENGLILLTHASEPVGHMYPGKGGLTPELLYPFILNHPDLKLVCAHWGGGLPFYSLMPEVNKALKNVYFDTAASPYLYSPQIYLRVCELLGSSKILFGSDYPLLRPQRLLTEIEGLRLSEDIRNRLLFQNAIALLGQ